MTQLSTAAHAFPTYDHHFVGQSSQTGVTALHPTMVVTITPSLCGA